MQDQRKAKDEGFTLIELLIVIIILGILAAIVVFAVGSTRGDSVKAACKTDVKAIQLAAEAYKTKNGAYPTTTGTGAAQVTGQAKLLDAQGGTLKSWPGGTSATNDDVVLAYASADGSTYTVTVTGKNFSGSTHVVTDAAPDTGTGAGTAASPYTVDQACTTS